MSHHVKNEIKSSNLTKDSNKRSLKLPLISSLHSANDHAIFKNKKHQRKYDLDRKNHEEFLNKFFRNKRMPDGV